MNIIRVVLAALLGSAILAGLVMDYVTPGADLLWNATVGLGIVGCLGACRANLAGKWLVTAIACAAIAWSTFAYGGYAMNDKTSAQAAKAFYNLIAAEHDGALANALGATTPAERARACNTPPPFRPPPGFMHEQKKDGSGKPICGEFRLVPAASPAL